MTVQPDYNQPRTSWWSRNWKWVVPAGCLTLILLTAAFIGTILAIVMAAMHSSDAYQTTVRIAGSDSRVQQALGTPVEGGFFVSGNVNVQNSSGTADVEVPLKGPKGKATVHVVGEKSGGTWKYSTMEFSGPGGERFDLQDR